MSYPLSRWRLIHSLPAPGSWNMAADEAILEITARGQSNPALRLYAWSPPCLSLGYAQPVSDVDLDQLSSLGWDLVRRPTGGRAILHTDELTYSVIAPLSEPRVSGSVLASYQTLSQALLHALRQLGVPAQSLEKIDGNSGTGNQNPVCFEVPSNYEITANGFKLVGSAQARRKEGFLQHGSLPLYGDLTRITRALRFPSAAERSEAAERLLSRAGTVESILGKRLEWEEAAEAFACAFREALNLDLYPADLTPAEMDRAQELVHEKYAHSSWTSRV
jgi:lipoyl(octanoyl) transferase